MRKTRLWICHQCKVVLKRKKSEAYWPCPKCGKNMASVRKYPSPQWFEHAKKIQERQVRQEQSFLNHISVPRDSHGKVLQITKKLREIWKYMEGIKQRPALQRAAVRFLTELHKNCIHRLGTNGMVEPPKVAWVSDLPGALGHYEKSLLQGKYHIEVVLGELGQMKATFIHEAVHHIDAEGQDKKGKKVGDGRGHDTSWRNRLKEFKRRLGVKDQFVLEAE